MKFVPLVLYVIAWVCAFLNQHFVPGDFVTYLLMYIFLFSVGIRYLWAFIGLTFCPEKIAECCGRKPSEFQYELGVATLEVTREASAFGQAFVKGIFQHATVMHSTFGFLMQI